MASEWPEHEKLQKVKDESHTIGQFLEGMGEKVFFLATYQERCNHFESYSRYCRYYKEAISLDKCEGCEDFEYGDSVIVSVNKTIEQVLADYFDIDLKKIEEEKRAMLEQIRKEGS